MAFLDIINIPRLLGNDVHSFKRSNVYDKLDLGLGGLVGVFASLVFLLTGFSNPLVCVPAGCSSSTTSTSCALDWTYQSGQCRAEALSVSAATFHYLLVSLSILLLGVTTIPLYWGSTLTKELFDNFYYIWAKLKNGDEECKDVEWKRRMHFVLDQLKSGRTLTRRYALYHGLALTLDLLSLLLVSVFTLSFSDLAFDPLGGGTDGSCALGTFSCTMPNKMLFKWFGFLTTVTLLIKSIVNLKCLLFCLGLPGLFGRHFLIYADSLKDNSGEKIFHVQTNPVVVLLDTALLLIRTAFLAPCLWSVAFCKFYARKYDGPREIIKRLSATNIKADLKEMKKVEKETKTMEPDASTESKKNVDASAEPKKEKSKEAEKLKEEEKKDEDMSTPLINYPMQNWSDLFFILDTISYDIDMCDIILFMTKICPVPGLETKKVSVEVSYLDTNSNTLIVSHTDAGVLEQLLDSELTTDGGLQIVGWLEGPTGIVSTLRTKDNPKNLAFAVSLGSTYELVSAVYARGRMLARLQNFTFQCPQDTKKQMKKYGQNVPLSAFISQSLFQKFSSDQGPQLN